jgi:Streptomyces sporulation and cell division protein, SsgA
MDSARNTEPVTVARTLTMEQIDGAGDVAPMEVEFSYDPRDPYAVSLSFVTAEPSVRWTFGRDLLMEGMYEPSGDGDVHVFPSVEASGVAVVLLELVGPEGEALVKARTREVEPFVDDMCAMVPPSTESAHLHVDETIAAILGQGA